METRPPQNAMPAVWIPPHNQSMERFASLRALAHRARPAAPTTEDATDSKLAGLLVLLVPVAALAWAAIGFYVYRLVT
jgi:hypothetical protein